MISYAQNSEDVVLARAFAGQAWGFYIDVGANHPEWDSVTKHFYDLGWRGINIEPMQREHELLTNARPGDVNLQVALGREPGRATLFETPASHRGSSTLVADLADTYRSSGDDIVAVDVEVTTLGTVCERWVPGAIDFLKVDVEGFEADVLAGADWERFRPRVLVIEAITPDSHEPVYKQWEPAVLAAGYELALFDGLNRFYALSDEPELLRGLTIPANVLDGYVPLSQASERDAVRRFLAEGAELLSRLAADVDVHQT